MMYIIIGAEQILKSNFSLSSIDIGKNNISSKIGTTLQYFISNSFKLQHLNIEHNNLQLKGIEFLTSGLMSTRTLRHLNVSGNSIGDKGLKVLLRGVEKHHSLIDLKISFNEITPIGGAFIIDALPRTRLKVLDMSRNIIEDETLIMLGDLYKNGDHIQLTHINMSSCHITDVGLLYFLESIQHVEVLKSIHMRDNFISEECEKILLELVDKNEYMHDIDLKGNRISMSCISRINTILKRNIHAQEIREPNKLKNEVYRLNFEKDKVKSAEKEINDIVNLIGRAEAEKLNLEADVIRFKETEEKARAALESKIEQQEDIIKKKKVFVDEKQTELDNINNEHSYSINIIIEKNNSKLSINYRSYIA